MDERAEQLLRRHGWEPQAQLGSGIEEVVVDLSAKEVAKVWHGRSRADLDALVTFSSALDEASLPFAIPRLLEVLEDDGLLVSIERKVEGEPLANRPHASPPVADARAVELLGDVLESFTSVRASAALTALPILPGDQAFTWGTPFPESLAALVERRFRRSPELLRGLVSNVDQLVAGVVASLRALPHAHSAALLHGDLIPANVMVRESRVAGVLDFGFLTTAGDPHFDAAITASVFDMYGPNARRSEDLLSEAFADRLGHDRDRYGLYRAAYAVVTHGYFGGDGTDGHFLWCAEMLGRSEVTARVLG